MSSIDKSIQEIINALTDLKSFNLESPTGPLDKDIVKVHEKIKEVQRLTSEFQQELSPIQKKINSKRISFLKKRAFNDPKKRTLAEAEHALQQYEDRFGPLEDLKEKEKSND